MKPSQRRPIFASIPGRPGMKQFIGFEGDPGTQSARPPRAARPGVQRFSGFGAISRNSGTYPPAIDGTPGELFNPDYNEKYIWGTGSETDSVTSPVDPSTAIDTGDGIQQFDPGISIPFGVSIIPWRNPTTMQSVPILSSTQFQTPVLSLNMQRNSLVIQNNSSATAPDIAPTFYVGFNAQPQVGLSLAVAPLAGILFDIITPRDSIYILLGPSVNGGGTVVVQGVVLQGTYAPI